MRVLYALMVSVLALATWSGCSPHRYTDEDATCSKAKALPPTITVKDELNVPYGDRTDCKQVRYFKDAVAKVEYRIGTAFEKHDLKGLVTVYDSDGQVLDQKAVDPSVYKYPFEFEIKANKPYYVEFKATEGSYAYSAQVAFTKKENPCDRCDPDEEKCVDGECVANKKGECDPECDEEDGMVCVEGECKSACNPPCRSKFVCDVESRECVKARKRCRPRCKRGEYCNYRNGKCYPRKVTKCKPGQIYSGGKCVALGGNGKPDQKCPACPNPTDICSKATGYQCISGGEVTPTGPIFGTVTSTVRAGQGTVFYLNRGKRHGVKAGKSGRLCGKFKFMVTNVYPTRSKARTSASIEELAGCKKASVSR